MEYIKAEKKYGQNFLKSEDILNKIASSVKTRANDLIIEIGPGMGALTKHLLKKNTYLICYEIDERMKEYLTSFETNKSKIIYDDFLKRDILEDIKDISYENVYIIANIPYYITSPIISKLMELKAKPKEIVLLVQKEFAERITADFKHKEYNAFTLYVDLEYDASLLFEVGKNHFIPSPKVDSAVIKLTKKEESMVKNKEFYLQFIKDAFQNKRKTLKNNLKFYDWENVKKVLDELGHKENVRAEEISKEDFKELANQYESKK